MADIKRCRDGEMRQELRKLNEVRATFKAIFVRFGTKNGWNGKVEKTVLLKDIKGTDGRIITDHLWFNCTNGFNILILNEGDEVIFDARVKEYYKGYKGYRDDVYDKPIEKDYRLSHPTKIRKVEIKQEGFLL
jgi:hypothetical protein